MLWNNFRLAVVLFFGWFLVDSLASIFFTPIEGIYYPMASGTDRNIMRFVDWSNKPPLSAPLILLAFSSIWIFFIRKAGLYNGLRVSALLTTFAMLPFWVVSSVTADMYNFEVNGYWLASMIYSNISFFIFGLIGKGDLEDLYF